MSYICTCQCDGKLAPRPIKCIFLGYASDSKGSDSKKIIQSQDVSFNEFAMFPPGEDSTVSSSSTGDHHDASDKEELEVPT